MFFFPFKVSRYMTRSLIDHFWSGCIVPLLNFFSLCCYYTDDECVRHDFNHHLSGIYKQLIFIVNLRVLTGGPLRLIILHMMWANIVPW